MKKFNVGLFMFLVFPLKSVALNLEDAQETSMDIELAMPMVENGYHDYFRDLLQQSLVLSKYKPVIHMKTDQPQKRVKQDLSSGQLSIY